MPQYGARGISYTPSFAQGMATMGQAMQGRRAEEYEDESNRLASEAWMGDQEAQQELMARNPELAMKIEAEATKRDTTEYQRGLTTDTTFKDDLELVIDQIGSFPDYKSARDYGQRMTDIMAEKYPERWQQSGIPTEFTEEAYNEIYTMARGTSKMKVVGSPYQVEHPTTGEPATAVVVQDERGNQYEKLMSGLDGGSLTRLSQYDVDLKRRLAESQAAGAELGGGMEERAQKAIDAGTAAAVQLPQINRSLALLDKIETSGLKQDINALQQYLGYEGEETAEMAELQQLLAVQMFDTLANFTGSISEGELKTAQALSTGLGKNPEANKKILKALGQRLARAIDLARNAAFERKDTIALALLQDFDPYAAAPYEGAETALPPAAATSKVPANPAALEYLQKNPGEIDAFVETYGYRPEGF